MELIAVVAVGALIGGLGGAIVALILYFVFSARYLYE